MNFDLIFNSGEFNKLSSQIKGNFDNPTPNNISGSSNLFFSGWFLSQSEPLYLKIKTKNKVFEKQLHVRRPDVLNYFNISSEFISCGFQFNLINDFGLKIDSFQHPIVISVMFDGSEYDLWTVINSDPNFNYSANIKEVWLSFFDEYACDFSNDTDTFLNHSLFLSSQFEIVSVSEAFQFVASLNMPLFEEYNKFSSFIEHFKQKDWAIDFLLEKNQDQRLFQYYCVANYIVEDFNYIHFFIDGLDFFIVQHCSNALIIFPKLFKCIELSVSSWALNALQRIGEVLKLMIEQRRKGIFFPQRGKKIFYGLNISQSRPYHYVYDYLHGLDVLCEKTSKYFKALSVSGFDFLDVSEFFNQIECFQSCLQDNLNDFISSNGYYTVMPCLQYVDGLHDRGLKCLSSRIRNRYANDALHNDYDLVVWFGISTEKRAWIEQVDGISNILNLLSNEYEKICVLIDGRTSTLNPSSNDSNTINEDRIFQEIKERVDGIYFISLVGATMSKKIHFSSAVDLFFSSYGTDSMYPSCIQMKSGVVYSPFSIGAQKLLHIHHNVIEVPCDQVKELDSGKKAWHETSVSMNWKDVYTCIQQALAKRS